MKIPFHGLDIKISDWSAKLKVATILCGIITVLFSVLMIFSKFTVPGFIPIAMGCTLLLLGVREYNIYFKLKEKKRYLILAVAITLTLLFALCLYIGINQIIAAVTADSVGIIGGADGPTSIIIADRTINGMMIFGGIGVLLLLLIIVCLTAIKRK
jgi:Na+-transporting methylmalonyl-CoA/oxaloacetate decarboxylase beta subunit